MNLSDLVMSLNVILPIAVLVLWACALLIIDLFIPAPRKGWTALLAAMGLAVALGLAVAQAGRQETAFNNMVVVDGFSAFLNVLFTGSGLAGIALAYDYLKRTGIERGEYYILLMFSVSGMMLMAQATDLIVMFLALELLSIPLYVLSGFARPQVASEEAALKYFLLGAFSGSFVVFGIALVFGATGTTGLAAVLESARTGAASLPLLVIGAGLVVVGLGFKVAAVPFHMWTPDVYQGAPSAVTAFMSVGAKAGGFAALLRIFMMAVPATSAHLVLVFQVLAILTMLLGNVVAIAQTNIKRMLAYSSIAHAGYILMALVTYGLPGTAPIGVASALFYLVAYAITSFGAWAVVIALEKAEGKGLELDDYAGLGRKYPALALAMAVFMLSFTGVPPTLGFMGKFYLFGAAIHGGFVGLAIFGVVTSLISAYFYLRVIVIMYMREGDPQVSSDPWLKFTAIAAAVLTVLLSLAAAPLFNLAARATLFLN